jgi:hypothetical protein
MDTVKDAVNALFGRKPTGPKIRYGVVAAGWISQSSFMPGVGQTSNSGISIAQFSVVIKHTIFGFFCSF